MSIEIISTLVPKNTGSFPVVDDNNIKGSFQVRLTLVDRDSIPTANRKQGMRVLVISNSTIYELGVGLTNLDWSVATSPPSGTAGGALTGTYPNPTIAQAGATIGQALVWNGSSWAPATVSGGSGLSPQDFTPTNGQTIFTLSTTPADSTKIYMLVNGVEYYPPTSFTIVGVTLTWLNIPFSMETTDVVRVYY